MKKETVWIDVARCTGCAACVEACAAGAIRLVDNTARVDEEMCTGCRACIEACPEGAIQPVVQGELVAAPERPAPTIYRPQPLAQSVAAGLAVASVGVLAKTAGALARVVGRWLARSPANTGMGASVTPPAEQGRGGGRGGRRGRHRHRGG